MAKIKNFPHNWKRKQVFKAFNIDWRQDITNFQVGLA